jgi:hypothetical protein
MTSREFRGPRQKVVQMAAPSSAVFAFAEALSLGRVQDLSIRPRTREAVSAFVVQIGFRTANTSSVATVSTPLARNAAAVEDACLSRFRRSPAEGKPGRDREYLTEDRAMSDIGTCPVAWENSSLLRSGFREQLVDILPVHQVIDPRLQIIRTAIAIIDVVWSAPRRRRRGSGWRHGPAGSRHWASWKSRACRSSPTTTPSPNRTADAGGGEIALEFLGPAEVFGDLLFQAAR